VNSNYIHIDRKRNKMLKKFVFILLASLLFNTSAHAAGAAGAFDWDAPANAPVKNVFSILQSALGALPDVVFGKYDDLASELCGLKSKPEYVSREREFDARVATHTQKLADALPAAKDILGHDQCERIMATYQSIAQDYRAKAAPLFSSPETAGIKRFVGLLPDTNLWADHMSGYGVLICYEGAPEECYFAPWALPTPAIKDHMHKPFEQALDLARKLNLGAKKIRHEEAPCLDFLSLKPELRWTLLAFIANKTIKKDGENMVSNPLILDLLHSFSNGTPVDHLKEGIRAALGQGSYEESDFSFKLVHNPAMRTPGEPAPLEDAAARQAAQEAEARARAAAIEAARPKPLLTQADHTLMREIQGRLDYITDQFKIYRSCDGYRESEQIMPVGNAGEFFKERLLVSLTEQFHVRGIPTEMAPINTATRAELSTWIQNISIVLEYNAEDKRKLIAGLNHAFGQAIDAEPYTQERGIYLFNSLVKLRKVYEKYHPTDQDNVLALAALAFADLIEHPGKCAKGAMGRGFLTEYKILTYLRDSQPNTAPGAVAGAAAV
jgi:hypothetical protein